MTKLLQAVALVTAFTFTAPILALAQEKPPAPPAAAARPTTTPLKVLVVISRFQGEKKISSLPYTLSMNAGEPSSLRMGAKVPVVMFSSPNPSMPKEMVEAGPIQYQDVGTNIDCRSELGVGLTDGRFRLSITVDDTSMYPDDPTTPGVPKGRPSFRSFRASDSMVLRDGQTSQFTTATDKVSGEIVKVDVTLTVVK